MRYEGRMGKYSLGVRKDPEFTVDVRHEMSISSPMGGVNRYRDSKFRERLGSKVSIWESVTHE